MGLLIVIRWAKGDAGGWRVVYHNYSPNSSQGMAKVCRFQVVDMAKESYVILKGGSAVHRPVHYGGRSVKSEYALHTQNMLVEQLLLLLVNAKGEELLM